MYMVKMDEKCIMRRYRVKYKVIHEKEFWVPCKSMIESVLSDINACEILEIEELESIGEKET